MPEHLALGALTILLAAATYVLFVTRQAMEAAHARALSLEGQSEQDAPSRPPSRTDKRGRAAKARIELTETEAAFDLLRSSALEAIAKSAAGDGEKREHLYRTVQTIDAIRTRLHELMDDGRMDEAVTEILQGNTNG